MESSFNKRNNLINNSSSQGVELNYEHLNDDEKEIVYEIAINEKESKLMKNLFLNSFYKRLENIIIRGNYCSHNKLPDDFTKYFCWFPSIITKQKNLQTKEDHQLVKEENIQVKTRRKQIRQQMDLLIQQENKFSSEISQLELKIDGLRQELSTGEYDASQMGFEMVKQKEVLETSQTELENRKQNVSNSLKELISEWSNVENKLDILNFLEDERGLVINKIYNNCLNRHDNLKKIKQILSQDFQQKMILKSMSIEQINQLAYQGKSNNKSEETINNLRLDHKIKVLDKLNEIVELYVIALKDILKTINISSLTPAQNLTILKDFSKYDPEYLLEFQQEFRDLIEETKKESQNYLRTLLVVFEYFQNNYKSSHDYRFIKDAFFADKSLFELQMDNNNNYFLSQNPYGEKWKSDEEHKILISLSRFYNKGTISRYEFRKELEFMLRRNQFLKEDLNKNLDPFLDDLILRIKDTINIEIMNDEF